MNNYCKELYEDLLHSSTVQEARENEVKLLNLLDGMEEPHLRNKERFTEEQMVEYYSLIDGMMEATHPKEVKFYEKKLHELMDQAEK